METTLSKDELDTTHIGYQPPQPKDTSEKQIRIESKKGKGRRNKDKAIYDPDNTMKNKDGDKRRDGDKQGKHEQEKDNNQKEGKKKRNFRKQLRDIIKDDEPKNRRVKGGRGNRERDAPKGNFNRDMPPPMPKGRGPRDRREMGGYPMNDDFYIRSNRGVRGARDMGPMMHGPPRYDYGPPYRPGPPPRDGRYQNDDFYDPYDPYYGPGANNYYGRP